MTQPPPRDAAELGRRACQLAGRTIAEIASSVGLPVPKSGTHGKGRLGNLVEKLLGASAGNSAAPDFPHLGIELKTIPVDVSGWPLESTFVCTISLADADTEYWEASVVRAKLSHVLWLPIVTDRLRPAAERRVGSPLFWKPTAEQQAILRADFDEAMGLIGKGGIEGLTARAGRWLQVRPKAKTGRSRTWSFGPDDEPIPTVPRGFYLRARFTGALLRDPCALPAFHHAANRSSLGS
jgi:DNA mismatch repair protein MutH